MKTLLKKIDSGLPALLVTNLWILLYLEILQFLNKTKVIPANKIFSGVPAAPEPFEIILYLGLTISFALGIFLMIRFAIFKRTAEFLKKTPAIATIITLLLSLLLIRNLGSYPLKDDTFSLSDQISPTVAGLIIMQYLLTLSVLTVLIGSLIKNKFFLYPVVALILAVFTFEPRLIVIPHDFSYFLGPIIEIANGKTIFTDVSSQYGFLSTILFGFLYRIRLIDPFILPILSWTLYILQYLICFYLLKKVLSSVWFALLGLFSIITINYFSLAHLPNSILQIGPLRFFPIFLALFLFARIKKLDSQKFLITLALLIFWIPDSGMVLLLSYLFSLFLSLLTGSIKLKKAVLSALFLGGSVVAIFILINLLHLLSGYQAVDLQKALLRINEFTSAGVSMIPIPPRSYFWLVIFLYFASIIYFFRQSRIELGGAKGRDHASAQNLSPQNIAGFEHLREGSSPQNLTQLLLFSANISFFTSVYFVGRSHPHNLFNISPFILLNFFFLFSLLLKQLKSTKTKFILFAVCFIFLLLIPTVNRKVAIATNISRKLQQLAKGNVFKPELLNISQRYYEEELKLIASELKNEEVVILSIDETYLFYLSGKKNLFLDSPQSALIANHDIKHTLKKAVATCPQKIVVTCTLFNRCPTYATLSHEYVDVQKIILSALEQSCKVKYHPTKCTDKLCVSSSI